MCPPGDWGGSGEVDCSWAGRFSNNRGAAEGGGAGGNIGFPVIT